MIIPMKKVRLIILKEDKEALLRTLQQSGEFMVIPSDDHVGASGANASVSESEAEAMLTFLNRRTGKKKFFSDMPQISYDGFSQYNEKGEKVKRQLEQFSATLSANEAEKANLQAQNESLLPWEAMTLPFEQIQNSDEVAVSLGFMPLHSEEVISELSQMYDAVIKPYGTTQDGQAVLVIHYRDGDSAFDCALAQAGFTEMSAPKQKGTVKTLIAANEKRIAELDNQNKAIDAAVKSLAEDEPDLALLTEQLLAKKQRQAVTYDETSETAILYGWVCEDRVDKVKKVIKWAKITCDFAFVEPEDGEMPPTVTRNPHFWAQFETITDMFSKPQPTEADPAMIAGPWYWVIFGMMMGDVGYGACMFVLFGLFKKLAKPRGDMAKLINVLWYSSVPTIIFGVIFGSYFGEALVKPLWFAPLQNPMKMLIFTLIVGVLHIFSGMGIKIYENVKAGLIKDAIFDQVSWMLLITGLGFLFLPALNMAGRIMAIVGAVIILCTAGREKPNIIGKITGGLLGLYDISSYMSDILSYSRILALSLATGVIGMVMNLLARMVAVNPIGWIGAIVIYLIGHVFNLAMSLLSAYVHDSRLQYIEFFNKFYEGGGRAFKPLAIESKYVDVKERVTNKED